MSVMGNNYVKPIIIRIHENDENEWKCGAFCVKFTKGNDEYYVVIDDKFPVYGNDRWCFVKGG
jgi:hypothetical protein